MRRWATAAATTLLLAVGALGLTGCGQAGGADQAGAGGAGGGAAVEARPLGSDALALAALGFDVRDIVAAEAGAAPLAAAPSATPGEGERGQRGDGWRRHRTPRGLLRENTLHGEVVVQTKDGGTRTVLAQRGTVTAIDDKSMTVKSADGFVLTWTFDEKLRVVERRTQVQPDKVAVGATVGVAGTKEGTGGVARLIVLPPDK